MSIKTLFATIISFALMCIFTVTSFAALSKGDSGDDVSHLQSALKLKGYFDDNITGYFGDITEEAVKNFQADNGFEVTGQVDADVMAALDIAVAIITPQNTPGKSLYIGESGDAVKLLQDTLKSKGFSSDYIIPSYYCEVTASLVAQYQRSIGLSSDGIAGEMTLSKLGLYIPAEGISYLKTAPTEEYVKVGGVSIKLREISEARASRDTVILEDEGSDVEQIQSYLKKLGYFSGNTTGYYGEVTQSAVKEFQTVNSLMADGKCGSQTQAVLFSSGAKAKPADKPAEPKPTPSENPQPTPTQKPDNDDDNQDQQDTISKMLAYAKTFLGTPYVYGANGPNSFDCTGYTKYVFAKYGVSLPRTAYDQGYSSYGTKINNISDLKPGDLVFFDTISDGDLSDHAGIYLGNGQFIHCSSSVSVMSVVISDLNSGFYNRKFSWGRRVF